MKRLRITALLAAITFTGCGEPPKDAPQMALHPLTEIVNVNGKPASGAIVSLHGSGATEVGVITPHGITDEQASSFIKLPTTERRRSSEPAI